MRKVSFLFILMVLIILFVFPQDYKGRARVRGYVYDEEGNPIKEVRVKLFHREVELGFDVLTDSRGMWVASWIKGGNWDIDFAKPGYKPKKIAIKIKEADRNPEVKVKLEKAEGPAITEDLKDKLNQGNNLFEEGRYEEAISAYRDILERFPEAYIINSNIAKAYFEMENYDQAIQHYQEVLKNDPENQEIMMYIGNCYANQGEDEKAQEWYDKIDFEKIEDVNVLFNMGSDFYNESKYEQALKYYKRAVELKGDFLDALYQLGLTHLSLSNYKEAMETFESYLKQDPDSERASQVKGFIDFLKKKIDS